MRAVVPLLALPLALLPASPASAEAGPPALPVPARGCVGASPVTVATPPWATVRAAPYTVFAVTTGAGVQVAVLDSGVSPDAAGLTGVVGPGIDVTTGGPAASDCLGRGTALAAIVAGRRVPGSGLVGMAPAATVLPVRIIDAQRRVTAASLAAGVRAAVARGATVVLVGTGVTDDSPELRAAVGEAVVKGAVVVAPVEDRGGDGGQQPTWYPAAYPEVLAVGGIGVTDTATGGPGADLLAPAEGAVAPAPTGGGHYGVGGTAVAAAHVAGAVALVRSYYPELGEAAVRARIVAAAERVGSRRPATLDTYAAVTAVDPLASPAGARRPGSAARLAGLRGPRRGGAAGPVRPLAAPPRARRLTTATDRPPADHARRLTAPAD